MIPLRQQGESETGLPWQDASVTRTAQTRTNCGEVRMPTGKQSTLNKRREMIREGLASGSARLGVMFFTQAQEDCHATPGSEGVWAPAPGQLIHVSLKSSSEVQTLNATRHISLGTTGFRPLSYV